MIKSLLHKDNSLFFWPTNIAYNTEPLPFNVETFKNRIKILFKRQNCCWSAYNGTNTNGF